MGEDRGRGYDKSKNITSIQMVHNTTITNVKNINRGEKELQEHEDGGDEPCFGVIGVGRVGGDPTASCSSQPHQGNKGSTSSSSTSPNTQWDSSCIAAAPGGPGDGL